MKNVYFALRLVANRQTQNVGRDLNRTCWTDELRSIDLVRLAELVKTGDNAGIQNYVASILPLYKTVWEFYGKPKTRELWVAKWLSGSDQEFTLVTSSGALVTARGLDPADAMLNATNNDPTLLIVGWVCKMPLTNLGHGCIIKP